jgi:hypothetical protein
MIYCSIGPATGLIVGVIDEMALTVARCVLPAVVHGAFAVRGAGIP